MDYQSMRLEDLQGRQRAQDCHCYPKKIYLRVIVPAPKEHLKYTNAPISGVSSSPPRSYTMVAKEMSFEMGRVIRRDTYGEIRLAHSSTSSKTIVVKCILKNHPQMQGYVRYILPREIALLKMLKGHPNVVSFIGVLDADHYAMVAMEHMEGMSLLDFIRMKHYMREDEARIVLKELLNTVITCHSLGISIRGLSCENVLLDKSLTPKISTFEHAIVRGYDKVDIFKGTNYSPPEVFEGRDYDSKAVDVWTLGVILYTMVTGTQPPSVADLDQAKVKSLIFPSYITSQCRKTIEKMLQPCPMRRTTMLELKQDEWLNGHYVSSMDYHNTDSDGDFTCQSLSSAEVRYGHKKKVHNCHSNMERNFCKNCFRMTNTKRIQSVELISEDNYEQRDTKHRGIIDGTSFMSRGERYRVPSNYTLMKNMQTSRSLSTGTLVSVRSEVPLDKFEAQNSALRSSKSMESVTTTTDCRLGDENNSHRATAGYSDIEYFLSEEKKQLADTNKVLAEEKRFLDFFDMHLPQGSKECATPTFSGPNKVKKPQLLDKSTSYQCNHVDQSTSCHINVSKAVCSVGVNAVVGTINQCIQSVVSVEIPKRSCDQRQEKVEINQSVEKPIVSSNLEIPNLAEGDKTSPIQMSSTSSLMANVREQVSETDASPISLGAHSLDQISDRLPSSVELTSASATELNNNSSTTIHDYRKKSVIRKFFSFLRPRRSLDSQRPSTAKDKTMKSVRRHPPAVTSMDSKVSSVTPATLSDINHNIHSWKARRPGFRNGGKLSSISVELIKQSSNKKTKGIITETKDWFESKPVEQ